MRQLRDAIQRTVERLARLRRHPAEVAAWYTPATLVEPLITALGWDVSDPDEVRRGYRDRSEDQPVDYALLVERVARVFVGVGPDLDDVSWTNQTIGHAAEAGVDWLVLTDGCLWRVYNLRAVSPRERRRFRHARIDTHADRAEDMLRLIAKGAVHEGETEEMWRRYFVDQQVNAELTKLFTGDDPDPDLLSLIAAALPSVEPDDIRASLRRARAVFDFPAPSAEPVPSAEPAPPAAQEVPIARAPVAGEPSQVPKRRVAAAERRIRLPELIAEKRLVAGSTLEATYNRERHYAVLLPDGRIRYRDDVYNSPSGAGAAVKLAVRGPDAPESVTATDGLEFWRTKDEIVGDVVPLKEIRRRVLETGGG